MLLYSYVTVQDVWAFTHIRYDTKYGCVVVRMSWPLSWELKTASKNKPYEWLLIISPTKSYIFFVHFWNNISLDLEQDHYKPLLLYVVPATSLSSQMGDFRVIVFLTIISQCGVMSFQVLNSVSMAPTQHRKYDRKLLRLGRWHGTFHSWLSWR